MCVAAVRGRISICDHELRTNHQCNEDRKQEGAQGAGRRGCRRDPRWGREPAACGSSPNGQERDQPCGTVACLRLLGAAGQRQNQRGQPLRGCFGGQSRQAGSLLPGIQIRSGQERDDTQETAVSVCIDRREQEVVELGALPRKRFTACHWECWSRGSSGLHYLRLYSRASVR